MVENSPDPGFRYGHIILPPDPLGMWATTPEEIKPGHEIYTPLANERPGINGIYVEAVEGFLEADKHLVWGWVIYRCTYESDEDWAQLLDLLH